MLLLTRQTSTNVYISLGEARSRLCFARKGEFWIVDNWFHERMCVIPCLGVVYGLVMNELTSAEPSFLDCALRRDWRGIVDCFRHLQAEQTLIGIDLGKMDGLLSKCVVLVGNIPVLLCIRDVEKGFKVGAAGSPRGARPSRPAREGPLPISFSTIGIRWSKESWENVSGAEDGPVHALAEAEGPHFDPLHWQSAPREGAGALLSERGGF